MPRNTSGNYTLPAGNPVTTGTTIASTWANPTMSDIGSTLEDSLSRTGKGNMLAPLKNISGTVSAPSITFTAEPQSGWYRAATGDIRLSIGGVDAARFFNGNLELWVAADSTWYPVVDSKSAGGTIETQSLTGSQTVVAFTKNVAGAALYVDGTSGDRGRLLLDTDYTYDAVANEVTLSTTYPNGTQLFAVVNDENDVTAAAAAASDSANAAAASESAAAASASNASDSESAAAASASAASDSETAAAASASAASDSESAAATSASNASDSESAAASSESAAAASASAASDSETAAAASETAASNSADLAEDWATSLTVVSGGFKGARGYAEDAAAIVATIPEGTIDDNTTSTTDTWSSDKISTELDGKVDDTIAQMDRYDLVVDATTATLDLNDQQVFTVDASTNRTLSFANVPGSTRSMTVVVRLSGAAGAITWPTIKWSGGSAPELNTDWTVVVLFWDGADWHGFKSGGEDT